MQFVGSNLSDSTFNGGYTDFVGNLHFYELETLKLVIFRSPYNSTLRLNFNSPT